jgi:hypothetical protein
VAGWPLRLLHRRSLPHGLVLPVHS